MSDFLRQLDRALDSTGYSDDSMKRDRPYTGQPHTCEGIRGAEPVVGLTMRDIRDCFIRAVMLSTGASGFPAARAFYDEADKGEDGLLSWRDVHEVPDGAVSLQAVCQNLGCEIEKAMGIFPNLPGRRAA